MAAIDFPLRIFQIHCAQEFLHPDQLWIVDHSNYHKLVIQSSSKVSGVSSAKSVTAIDWLLDSDPAIRWQVMRDLTDAPPELVAAERGRIAREGWGARLLDMQGEDGQWAGGACFPSKSIYQSVKNQGQPWISTLPTLQLLHDFGLDPHSDRVRRAVAMVRDGCRWEHAGQPFFSGEVEPCINGRVVTLGTSTKTWML